METPNDLKMKKLSELQKIRLRSIYAVIEAYLEPSIEIPKSVSKNMIKTQVQILKKLK